MIKKSFLDLLQVDDLLLEPDLLYRYSHYEDLVLQSGIRPIILVETEFFVNTFDSYIQDFEDYTDFSVYENSDNLSNIVKLSSDGEYALSFDKIAGGTTGGVSFSETSALDLTGYEEIRIDVQLNDLSNVLFVKLVVRTDASNYRTYSRSVSDFAVGWNKIYWTVDDADEYEETGTFDITDVNSWIAYVEFENNDDVLANIAFDYLRASSYEFENTADLGSLKWAKQNIITKTNGIFYEGRLRKVGKITRSISERRGLYNIGNTSFEIINTDRFISDNFQTWGSGTGIKNKPVNIKLGMEDVPLSEFETIYSGLVDNLDFSNLTAKFSVKDNTKKYFDRSPKKLIEPTDWSELDDKSRYLPYSIIYGEIVSDRGPLPTIYMGEYSNEHLYVIAGHHCKNASGTVYLTKKDETPFSPSGSSSYFWDKDNRIDVTPGNGTFVYNGTTTSGQKYTAVKIARLLVKPSTKDPPSADPDYYINPWKDYTVSVSISGKTDDGTSTGTVITDVVDVLQDFLVNEAYIPIGLLDLDSFATTQIIINQRNQIMAGAIVKDQADEDIIAQMCVSHNFEFFLNRDGKFAIDTFVPEITDVSANLYTDRSDIISGSFKIDSGMDKIINRIRYKFEYDYSRNEFDNVQKRQNSDSIRRCEAIYDWPNGYLELKWNRQAASAMNVAQKQLDKFKNGRTTASLRLPLSAFREDLTNKIRISHYEAPEEQGETDKGGWKKHLCRVKSLGVDPSNFVVDILVENLQDLSGSEISCLYLGDRTTFTSSWLTTNETEKLYMYLPNRTTEKFSNGDDAAILC